MAVLKAGKWTYSAEELEKMYAEAEKRGKERLRTEPRANRAAYDPQTRRMLIELRNGCTLFVPVDLLQGLRGASDEDLADFSLMPRGFDLHWHRLDAQFTVDGLLKGLFGTKKWMAALNQPSRILTAATAKQPARPAPTAAANKRSRSAA